MDDHAAKAACSWQLAASSRLHMDYERQAQLQLLHFGERVRRVRVQLVC